MADMKAAWKRVMELVEQGDGYTRTEEDGAVTYHWGKRRLKHTLYEPASEEDVKAFEEDVRELPAALRELITSCSNGVELLGGDLTIGGVNDTPAGSISFIEEHKTGEVSSYFGSAGTDKEPLYLGEDGGVRLGYEKDARWVSVPDLLLSVLEQGLDVCWDSKGKRIADLSLAAPLPELDDDVTLRVPKTHAKRLDSLRAALQDLPETVKAADARFGLFKPAELGKQQIGYRVHPRGDDLTGRGRGDWKPTWIVIGTDEDLGDPLFVDVADDALPVYTAMHGQGDWEPDEVAGSLDDLRKR